MFLRLRDKYLFTVLFECVYLLLCFVYMNTHTAWWYLYLSEPLIGGGLSGFP